VSAPSAAGRPPKSEPRPVGSERVNWGAKQSVHEAYIEAIMIGAFGNNGFAWRSPGYVLKEIAD